MLVNSTDMKKDKIKKRKLYKRGGRITYYNMGGMYGNNTVPTSMINPGPQASYEQVNQAQINAGENQLAQIQANPWQQQFQQQQTQRDQTNQMLNQSLTQGTSQLQSLATERFKEDKNMFGMNQDELLASQYGTADAPGGMHAKIFGEQSAANYAAGEGMTAGQANLYGQAANLVGQGITAVSDDDDATTMNVGETSGTVLSGMGKGAATGATIGSIIPGVGTAIGAGVGAVVGGISSGLKGKKARDEAREMEAEEEARKAQANQAIFAGNLTGKEYTGSDMGTLRTGGRPGLWANIHAKRKRIKAGSGEKMRKPGSKGAPTDAALKRSQNQDGGYREGDRKRMENLAKQGQPKGTKEALEEAEKFAQPFVLNRYYNATRANKLKKMIYNDRMNKDGGYRNFYMEGGLLNYASQENSPRKFVGGGYDFSRTPDGKKVEVGGPVDPNKARLALDVAGMFNPLAGFAAGVLDANDARKYLQEGDYMNALKSAGMAGLGFIPWGGSFAKAGIKGVSKLAKTPIKPLVNTGSSLKVATSGGKTAAKSTLKTDKHMAANKNMPLVVPPASGPSQSGPIMDPTNTMMLGYRHGGTKQLDGGVAKPLPGGATEFVGKKHEQGGIKLDPMTEVEGGETMDKVQGSDYFFSSYLKLGGKSFAQRHKDILKKGGSQQDIERLAAIQEKAAGRDKYDLGGERKKYANGGGVLDQEGYQPLSSIEIPEGKEIRYNSELGAFEIVDKIDNKNDDPVTNNNDDKKNDDKKKNDSKKKTNFTGLYNKVTDEDIAEYLDEAAAITGLDTFDPRNPEHVKLLQSNLMNPSEELKNSNPTFFSGRETDILEGDLGKNKQGVDGKFGIDTLNALKEFSELQEVDIYEVEPGSYDPNIYQFNPYLDIVIDEDPDDEYQWTGEPEIEEESPTAEEENTKKRSGFLRGLGQAGIPLLGAGLQLLPAYMAFKEKPDYMAEPGRIPETHLDRVRFNAEREQNEGNYRGMSRFIEQSGAGPGGIAAKMASWGKKQAQDVQIGSAEARANAQIQQQEAAINSQNTRQNIANRITVDEFNRAADAATKDRKLMAVQNAVQSIAGMGADYLQYKAQDDLSRAIAGQTNVLDNFYTHELDFQRLNPGMEDKKGTPEYSNAFAGYLKKLSNNTNQREGGYRSLYGRGGRKMLKKC